MALEDTILFVMGLTTGVLAFGAISVFLVTGDLTLLVFSGASFYVFMRCSRIHEREKNNAKKKHNNNA